MIATHGLTRSFFARRGVVEAVRGVSLHVDAGEIVGFLGPNGAGKTTTQRMLVTLLRPTAGSATVAGHDLLREPQAVRRRIGYVAQGGCTDPVARVGEELIDHARLYSCSPARARGRAEALVVELDLADVWDRPTATLSGGQRRRLDIAMGLVHRPDVLFLDEPTTGLDPHARTNVWQHIRALRDVHGVTLFLTTHYLEEADALCDRIVLIDRGAIVAEGTPEALKRSIGGDTVHLLLVDRTAAAAAGVALGPFEPEIDGPHCRLAVQSALEALPEILRTLDMADVAPLSVEVRQPTLDDVFLAQTGCALADKDKVPA